MVRRLLALVGLAVGVAATLSASQVAQTRPLPYRDGSLSIETRVRDLLSRMTLEDKFWQLFMIPGNLDTSANDYSLGIFGLQIDAGSSPPASSSAGELARAHAERINAIQRFFVEQTRLGIPIIPFDEAVHGLARDGATMFPAAIGLAATWDLPLVGRVAEAIADEARTRGIRQVLSPVVNIADDVRWGRVEETYGEDPVLASTMSGAYVGSFERAGVVTTPKHFVANVGEGGRDSYPIDYSERRLAERYFPPFQAAIEAGALSVMTAYNSVDGVPATQNGRLLNGILKGDWAFRGFVISDASATSGATVLHMTEPNTPAAAADAWLAGLDVVFQSAYGQQRPYLDAVERGLVPVSVIDAAVARVLRIKFELGLFDHPYVDPEAAARENGSSGHRLLAREAEREAIVLLKNAEHALPLDKNIRSVAVIGVDAEEARLGGYSASGATKESILTGIRRIVGSQTTVRYEPGPGRSVADFVVVPPEALSAVVNGAEVPGLAGEYYDNPRLEGPPRLTRTDTRMDFRWTLNAPGRGIPFDWYSVRWTGALTAPASGVQEIGVEGNDGYRLWIDGTLVVDDWVKRSYDRRTATVAFAPGSRHQIRLEYFEPTGNARLRLVWNAGLTDDSQTEIARAVTAAAASDTAIVVVGIEEGEFRDRAKLGLPGRQEELIERVASTGRPTIVVLIGGSAITMSPWLNRVAAVLDAWYPGEAGGPAVADILFGDANPAGRLPITFPIAEGQLPLSYDHKPTGRGDDYVDLTGMPLFPFGFGLSYTTFQYSNFAITPETIDPTSRATVSCVVQNTGPLEGDEVLQLYIHHVLSSVAQPVEALKAFRRVRLAPGERATIAFLLGPADLRILNQDRHWVVEPGTVRVLIGSSSKDIRLRGELTIK